MARQYGTTRLFVEAELGEGGEIALAAAQAHTLATVLRARVGDTVLAFNGRDGEWRGRIAELGARRGRIALAERVRAQPGPGETADIWLAFAPPKRSVAETIVQKATELGVARIVALATARTRPGAPRPERMAAIAVHAAEQCGRLDVPELAGAVSFEDFLRAGPADRRLLLADAGGGGQAMSDLDMAPGETPKWTLVIGPEGGFTETELDLARRCANLSLIDLGPRVLRADTGAIAGLAILQCLYGDWARYTKLQ